MSKAIGAVIGIVEIAAGAVLDYFSFGTAGNTLIAMGVASLLSYAISLLVSPRKAPLIPIGASYAGTLEPRRIIFGTVQCGGMYVIPPMTAGTNNDQLHMVFAIAGHPIDGFGDIYFNQIRIANADIGAVTGTMTDGAVTNVVTNNGFQGLTWIRRYNGTQTAVDTILTNNFTVWDSHHIGQGVAYWAIQLAYNTTAFYAGVPQISGIIRGARVYDPRLDSTNGGSGSQRATVPSTWVYSTNAALCLRWYLTNSLGLGEAQARINDPLVAAAANICDETVTVPIPVIAGLTSWTNGSTLVGGVGSAFLRDLNNGQFTQSGSNWLPTVTTYVLGPDSAMHQVASVQNDHQLTLSASFSGTTTAAAVTQWNNSTATTTTQKRYTCNTMLDATAAFPDNIATLARAMMGQCIYSSGQWCMYAGAWTGSSFSLAEDDLVGAVSIQCATPRQYLYNAIRGNFLDPNKNWQPNEFPPVIDTAYATEDGETIFTETNFAACSDIYEAQRDAIITLQASRDQHVVTAQFGMSAYGVRVWDTGTITLTEIGWVNQTVRCINWRFLPRGIIELTLQEAYAADWTDPTIGQYVTHGTNANSVPGNYLPYPPTGLTATAVPEGIEFKVTLPLQVLPGTLIQLWEYTANSPFSSATMVAQSNTDSIFLSKRDTVTRFYWVRTAAVTGGQVSPTYPSGNGVSGSADLTQTGDVALNAATVTYLFSLSNAPTSVSGPLTNDGVLGSNITAPPAYACTAIVTVTGFDGYISAGSGATVAIGYNDTGLPGGFSYGNSVALPTSSSAPSTTMQWQFPHAASSATANAEMALSVPSGCTVTFANLVLQVEYIKR